MSRLHERLTALETRVAAAEVLEVIIVPFDGEAVGLEQQRVAEIAQEMPDLEALPNPAKLAAMYQDADWQPPLEDSDVPALRYTFAGHRQDPQTSRIIAT